MAPRAVQVKVEAQSDGSFPRLLRVPAAAERLNVSTCTIRRLAYSGKVASHKISNRLMFAEADLQQYVDESRQPRAATIHAGERIISAKGNAASDELLADLRTAERAPAAA